MQHLIGTNWPKFARGFFVDVLAGLVAAGVVELLRIVSGGPDGLLDVSLLGLGAVITGLLLLVHSLWVTYLDAKLAALHTAIDRHFAAIEELVATGGTPLRLTDGGRSGVSPKARSHASGRIPGALVGAGLGVFSGGIVVVAGGILGATAGRMLIQRTAERAVSDDHDQGGRAASKIVFEDAVGSVFDGSDDPYATTGHSDPIETDGEPKAEPVESNGPNGHIPEEPVDSEDGETEGREDTVGDTGSERTQNSEIATESFNPSVVPPGPIVERSVEASAMADVPNLIEALERVALARPELSVDIDTDTGEHIVGGPTDLFVETAVREIERDWGIDLELGEPVVRYREVPTTTSEVIDVTSPNEENEIQVRVEQLPEAVLDVLDSSTVELPDPEVLVTAGLDRATVADVVHIHGTNLLVADTADVANPGALEHVIEGAQDALDQGPLAAEPVRGAVIRVVDSMFDDLMVRRGPAQVIPMIREAIHQALINSSVRLFEPVQAVQARSPLGTGEFVAETFRAHHGADVTVKSESGFDRVDAELPLSVVEDVADDLSTEVNGQVTWKREHLGFQRIEGERQHDLVRQIRNQKSIAVDDLSELRLDE